MTRMKPHELNEEIAIRFFGWRWLAFVDVPCRSTPGYPKVCKVRRLFPPAASLEPSWEAWFTRMNPQPAAGDEPLAYCYESFNGPHRVPDYAAEGFQVLEQRIIELELFDVYLPMLGKTEQIRHMASGRKRCLAALKALKLMGGPWRAHG